METTANSSILTDIVRYSVKVNRKGFKVTKNFTAERDAEMFCKTEIEKGNRILEKIRWHR